MKSCLILIACLSILFIGCKKKPEYGSFTDFRDGHTYKTVKIGDQVWMAENLSFLPKVSPGSSGSESYPYYYVYSYDGSDIDAAKRTTNYKTYGVLYNWPAAMKSCPDGWHLPSDEEWRTLIYFLGGIEVAGGKLKEKGTAHWRKPNKGATDESGFSALPGGSRPHIGPFYWVGGNAYWWSSWENSPTTAGHLFVVNHNSGVTLSSCSKASGLYVRCIKD